jgi:hypothetical protein
MDLLVYIALCKNEKQRYVTMMSLISRPYAESLRWLTKLFPALSAGKCQICGGIYIR